MEPIERKVSDLKELSDLKESEDDNTVEENFGNRGGKSLASGMKLYHAGSFPPRLPGRLVIGRVAAPWRIRYTVAIRRFRRGNSESITVKTAEARSASAATGALSGST